MAKYHVELSDSDRHRFSEASGIPLDEVDSSEAATFLPDYARSSGLTVNELASAFNTVTHIGTYDDDYHAIEQPEFAERVNNYLADIGDMLIAKNKAYGDSVLNPIRVFSKANPVEQLRVRLDDKLSRIAKGTDYAEEDTIKDTLGYLVLLALATEGTK